MNETDSLEIAAVYGFALLLALIVLALLIESIRSGRKMNRMKISAQRAEQDFQEMKKALMVGSAVGRWRRCLHFHTAEGPVLLTEREWLIAKARAKKRL